MKLMKSSLKYQLHRRFLISVILVGFLFIALAIETSYFSMQNRIQLRNEQTQILIENIIQRIVILERELNNQLMSDASKYASVLHRYYGSGLVTEGLTAQNTMLFRIIDRSRQVTGSNYVTDLPADFAPNAMLIRNSQQSAQDFYAEQMRLLDIAFSSGTATAKEIDVFGKEQKGAYVIYKPFSNQQVIEVVSDIGDSKLKIWQFFNQELEKVYASQELEGLILNTDQNALFSKGSLSGVKETDGKGNQLPLLNNTSITIGTLHLTFTYRLDPSRDIRGFIVNMVWIALLFAFSVLFFYLITKRESDMLLQPLEHLLQNASDAGEGRYDKRASISGFVEISQLSETYNQMMDRIESLLDDKKSREYKLREMILSEAHRETTEDLLCEEAITLVHSLKTAYHETESFYIQMMMALSSAIEAKDIYTAGHCQRVMDLSVKLAEVCGLSQSDIENVRLGALLHDVGKLGIQEEILNKPGILNDYERTVIQRHCRFGEEIIAELDVDDDVKRIVLSHHEFFNGKGYPNGLSGEDIILGARIICLVDAFDAMQTIRPYRLNPLSLDEAVAEIKSKAGEHFDPFLVDILLRKIESEEGLRYE